MTWNELICYDHFSWGQIISFKPTNKTHRYIKNRFRNSKEITGIVTEHYHTGGGSYTTELIQFVSGKPTKKFFHMSPHYQVKYNIKSTFKGILKHRKKIIGENEKPSGEFDRVFIFKCDTCKATIKACIDIRDDKRFARLHSQCDILKFSTKVCPNCGSEDFKEITNWQRNIPYVLESDSLIWRLKQWIKKKLRSSSS